MAEHKKPVAIYNAAGKEIVFGYILFQMGIGGVLAIDDDPDRHGLFMDASGIMFYPT